MMKCFGIPVELSRAINGIYLPAGLKITHPPLREAESAEYGACRFALNSLNIVYRVAKTTPKKEGQFVTTWKRPTFRGRIVPLDITDAIDFLVVHAFSETEEGQFIFARDLLLRRSILSRDGIGGKLSFRIYPPWSRPDSKVAMQTRQWQLENFLHTSSFASNPEAMLRNALRLLRL